MYRASVEGRRDVGRLIGAEGGDVIDHGAGKGRALRTVRAGIPLRTSGPLRTLWARLALRARRTTGITLRALRSLWTFRPLCAGIADRALRTLYPLRSDRPL